MIKKYICIWCNHEFESNATYSAPPIKNGKKQKWGKGNMIRCPKCQRFIEKFPKIKIGDKTIHKRW